MKRSGRPVLVVEDDADTREMVELFLQQDGYQVCTARDGLEALECVERAAPCLILLDITMPVMDGVTFAHRLRALPNPAVSNTPIVLLTALPNSQQVRHDIGAVDVLQKPVEFDAIVEMLERYCATTDD